MLDLLLLLMDCSFQPAFSRIATLFHPLSLGRQIDTSTRYSKATCRLLALAN
jgi:hypothetical protein